MVNDSYLQFSRDAVAVRGVQRSATASRLNNVPFRRQEYRGFAKMRKSGMNQEYGYC